MPVANVSSFAACCALCFAKEPGDAPFGICAAWSWNANARACWLKDGSGTAAPKVTDISGVLDSAPPVPVAVRTTSALATTNRNFASWNVDASYNRGFVHIDFSNVNLLAAATSLAPSTMRFGGGGNDYLRYTTAESEPPLCTSDNDSDAFVCLNASHFDDLYGLAERSGTDVIFGISFDMNRACAEKEHYVWDGTNAAALLKSMRAHKMEIWAFELGNEVNNRESTCALNATQQAAAMRALDALVDATWPPMERRPLLIGPDTGYRRPQEWLATYLDTATHYAPPLTQPIHAVTHRAFTAPAHRGRARALTTPAAPASPLFAASSCRRSN